MKEHNWVFVDEDSIRCMDCDCRFGGKWHDLPCGSAEQDYIAYANAQQKDNLN